MIFPPGVAWQNDGREFIDGIMPIRMLQKLFDELHPDYSLEIPLSGALDRLRRFLNDEFRHGEIVRATAQVSGSINPVGQSLEAPAS